MRVNVDSRRLVKLGFTIVLVAAGVAGARALRRELLPMPEDRCRASGFDAAAWRDSARVHSAAAVRGCMVDDLLERHALAAMDRRGVVRLLGEPDRTPYFREYDMVYWLGPERGLLSLDSEWLAIRLDGAGRVVEHRIVTD